MFSRLIASRSSAVFVPACSYLRSLIACGTIGLLTGCTLATVTPGAPSPAAGAGLAGHVHGGQQPVTGAKVYLYAASTFANAGSATSLLKAPGYVLTDSNGNFAITADYTCPANTSVYLLALGGNPGLQGSNVNNPDLALAAGVGPCSSLTPTSFYSVNEATTVALAYSLTSFATSETRIGAPSAQVLTTAFANTANLVNPADGTVHTTTPAGNGTVPQAKLDTLADALAYCINSSGTGAPCSTLMAAANVSSSGPVDTFQAILNISQNPAANVTAIYKLAGSDGPFQPTLTSPPTDWTLDIQYPPPVSIALSPASAALMQSGQQEFSASVKDGLAGSYQWTSTADAGLLNEVGGTGQTGKTTYCSTSPVTNYVSNATPVVTTSATDTVTVQAFAGTGCVPANSLSASGMANVTVDKAYTRLVIFGDSYSDTGNVANLTGSEFGITYPGPDFNYTGGRFTNDTSTTPAAVLYTGTWVDQLAGSLPAEPSVLDSLDGGPNYAYGDATTADGTTSEQIQTSLSFTVENMGQQITDYLATVPVITNQTLFIVWGGTDELTATSTDSAASESAAALREVALIQRLIDAGATDFLVPNIPPLGALPDFNTSANAAAKTQAAAGFNQALAAGLANLPAANPAKTLRLLPLDVFSLFTATVGPPVGVGFIDATGSAQGVSGVDPDTYLFWDDLHPTTGGHHIISAAASTVISPM